MYINESSQGHGESLFKSENNGSNLNTAEFYAGTHAAFRELDRNGDGLISVSELASYMTQKRNEPGCNMMRVACSLTLCKAVSTRM